MPAKKIIPVYSHFNQSLFHLHLPTVSTNKLYHVFKWKYSEDQPISYPASRQEYYDITFFVKANFTHHLNTDAFSMRNHSLHILTPGQAEQFNTNTHNRITGFGIYFMPAFLFNIMPRQQLEKDFSFLKNGNRNVFYLTPAQSLILQQIFETTITEANLNNDDIVRHYLFILLYKIKTFCLSKLNEKKNTPYHTNLVSDFEKLVLQFYSVYTKISDYAKMLHVTTRILAEAIKNETGKTPKQLLQETIFLEAKLLLLHSSMPIAEIAAQLNFHDAPHFTRYFAKVTGLSPQQFRKETLV